MSSTYWEESKQLALLTRWQESPKGCQISTPEVEVHGDINLPGNGRASRRQEAKLECEWREARKGRNKARGHNLQKLPWGVGKGIRRLQEPLRGGQKNKGHPRGYRLRGVGKGNWE